MELIELKKEEYKEFTKKNNAHFLESYEWGEIAKYRKYDVFYLGLKDNGKLKATCLILKKNMPLNYSYFYIPRGFTVDYNDKNLLKELTLNLKKFAKKHKAIFFKIDPDLKLHTIDYDGKEIDGLNNYELVNFLKKIGYKYQKLTYFFETMQPRFTFRIPLNDSIEEIESRYTSTTKSRIKKASNSMISVEEGNINDIKEFVRLMKMTEKRQNFYSHDLNYYNYFYKIFKEENMVKLYLAKINIKSLKEKIKEELNNLNSEFNNLKDNNTKKANNRKKELEKNIMSLNNQYQFLKDKKEENIVVSSYLTVFYNNKAWALYAANDMEYKTFYPNYLVYQKQIRDAKECNLEIFDVFGTIGRPNSDNHLVGLHDFKKKWGGEYIEFIGEFDYVLKPVLYFIYKKIIPLRHKIINKHLRKRGK